jgi:hypothetical protein
VAEAPLFTSIRGDVYSARLPEKLNTERRRNAYVDHVIITVDCLDTASYKASCQICERLVCRRPFRRPIQHKSPTTLFNSFMTIPILFRTGSWTRNIPANNICTHFGPSCFRCQESLFTRSQLRNCDFPSLSRHSSPRYFIGTHFRCPDTHGVVHGATVHELCHLYGCNHRAVTYQSS